MTIRFKKIIQDALKNVDLEEGDIVLLHSDSTVLREITGLNWAEVMNLLKDCFLTVLGDGGTLIVPTFNWDFCKGNKYVHEKARSQVGMFTNFILSDELSIRSFHPIYSFAGIGPATYNIFNSISKSSFGENSVFHKLHQNNAKIILFNYNLGTTFVHYVEQKLGVDYRYIKYFTGQVSRDGLEYQDTFDFYARYLDRDINVSLKKLHKYLFKTGKMKRMNIKNRLNISMFTCEDVNDVIIEKIIESPYFLLANQPVYDS